jgi:hypothetical protein
MLTIKDLAVSKSLDSKEMAAVSGGYASANVTSTAFNQAFNESGKGGLVNNQLALSIPTTTVVDVNPGFGGFGGFGRGHEKMYA